MSSSGHRRRSLQAGQRCPPSERTANWSHRAKNSRFQGLRASACSNSYIKLVNGTLISVVISRSQVLVLKPAAFANVDIRVRVSGGGHASQVYAIRQAIGKAIVAYTAKYEDAAQALDLKKALVAYDRTLLVADPRRCEPKKFGGPGQLSLYGAVPDSVRASVSWRVSCRGCRVGSRSGSVGTNTDDSTFPHFMNMNNTINTTTHTTTTHALLRPLLCYAMLVVSQTDQIPKCFFDVFFDILQQHNNNNNLFLLSTGARARYQKSYRRVPYLYKELEPG